MNQSVNQSANPDDDHWEIYVTYVDDNPAVILVDIGVAEAVPVSDLPTLVWIWIHLKTTDEEGFPSEDEDFRLNEIEDLITEGMGDLRLRYVGRITTDGRREFYFYTNDAAQFQAAATAAMSSVPEYEFEIDEADDAEWRHYQDVLYPSPEDFQQIHNQHVINQLQSAGDTLTQPRPVDHYANFRTEEDRAAFIAAAAAEGFESVSRPDRTDEGEFPFAVGLLRVDPVDPETIDRITFELFDLARQHTGEYEGWGAKVVKS